MRGRIVCLLLALLSTASAAEESPVGISGVETADVKLYYYDYLGNIAPLAIRTFTNAREWQRRVFGWSYDAKTGRSFLAISTIAWDGGWPRISVAQ